MLMSVLANPRHERFAQELAKGTSASEAYVLAGYRANRGNAATLKQDQNILARVTELLEEREEIHSQATAEAVERAGLTKEWVIARLMENVQRASQAQPVMAGGVQTGEYRYEGSVVNRGLELLGKELGMFVDRTEDVTARRTSEQIYARLSQIIAAGDAGRSSGTDRGVGPASEDHEAIPTVPGHGTA
jgi:phage terminase small subunit